MKKIEFFFLAAVAFIALCTTTHFLSSCSEDVAEEQEQQLTKADILRTNAKEFAKKYNVNMTLNEKKNDSLVKVLTVEQIERDFQEFVEFRKSLKTVSSQPLNNAMKGNRLKINKIKKLSEYINTRISGTVSCSFSSEEIAGRPRSGTIDVEYECGGNGRDCANIILKTNSYVGEACFPAYFTVNNGKVASFTTSGRVHAYSKSRTYHFFVDMSLHYTDGAGLSIISIT